MQISAGQHKYEWIDDWAQLPDDDDARTGWSHHGVAVSTGGTVIALHQAKASILVFDEDGCLERSWDTDLAEAHGITIVTDRKTEFLWLADNGRKRTAALAHEYPPGKPAGKVIKQSLAGETVGQLDRPHLPVYRNGVPYSPTAVAVHEAHHGGNGDIWVADGYGANHVHRYDKNGRYHSSINGTEGAAGAFDTPHGIYIDYRKSAPELYVADRANARVQVYDLDGHFKRSFGKDFLSSPSVFAQDGGLLIIGELRARLTLVDATDQFVGYLGANETVCEREGWPNRRDEHGQPARPDDLVPGKFNSPHGLAADQAGNLYVAEWLIGGRFTKLAKL